MDAEHWQTTPSKIFIKDLDGSTFNIKLMGYGRFKIKGGKIYKTVFHQYGYKGNEFEFYFASGQLGMDLNKQPQVWKDFLETNMRVAMSVLIVANEGSSFEQMRKMKGKFVSKTITNKISHETVYGSSKLAFGTREYYNSTLSFLHNTKKDCRRGVFNKRCRRFNKKGGNRFRAKPANGAYESHIRKRKNDI